MSEGAAGMRTSVTLLRVLSPSLTLCSADPLCAVDTHAAEMSADGRKQSNQTVCVVDATEGREQQKRRACPGVEHPLAA